MFFKSLFAPATLSIRVEDFNTVVHKPDLLKKLRKLTLRSSSGMNYELNWMEKEALHRKLRCKVLLAYRSKKLVGWALLSKESTNFIFTNTYQGFDSTDGVLFEIFVNPTYRRQGIGTELLKKAKQFVRDKALCISPWDHRSDIFYSKFDDLNKKVI